MRLLPSLAMLLLCLLLFIISSPSHAQPQSPVPAPGPSRSGARSLDALLQDYAYQAFDRPRVVTGVIYDATVPSNLTGIKIAAMRLRCGSLRTRGVARYKEFKIPMGITVQPYVERLVLVYQNLGNWSQMYYPLPGYTYLTPVLGLIAYDAFNLKAKGLPELNIRASGKPISVEFNNVGKVPDGEIAQCVWFDSDGLVQFSNVVSGNVCSTGAQGHFGIVVKGILAPAPAPVAPSPSGGGGGGGRKKKKKINSKVWKIVAAVIGGFLLLVLLGLLICCMQRYKRRKKMQQMEKAAEVGESLQMTSIGNTRAPIAMGTRTQPVIENEYVP